MFSEVVDVYLFVADDAVTGAFFCEGVEGVASEEFFGVAGAEVDDLFVNVGVVFAEFCDVDFVGGSGSSDEPVCVAFAVFAADCFEVLMILFDEVQVEFFKDVGEVATVQGCFARVGGPRVEAGQ